MTYSASQITKFCTKHLMFNILVVYKCVKCDHNETYKKEEEQQTIRALKRVQKCDGHFTHSVNAVLVTLQRCRHGVRMLTNLSNR